MDSEILAELKKINLQLAQIVQKLNIPEQFPDNNKTNVIVRDIASEVQAKIADARRRAESSMPVMQFGAMPGLGVE